MTRRILHDPPSQQIESWLLSLLRFAITRRDKDRAIIDVLARGMDSLGSRFEAPAFDFFSRTSAKLCEAIVRNDAGAREEIHQFLGRIESPGLRRAFEAVFDLSGNEPAKEPRPGRKPSRQWLWQGLTKRDDRLASNRDAVTGDPPRSASAEGKPAP